MLTYLMTRVDPILAVFDFVFFSSVTLLAVIFVITLMFLPAMLDNIKEEDANAILHGVKRIGKIVAAVALLTTVLKITLPDEKAIKMIVSGVCDVK